MKTPTLAFAAAISCAAVFAQTRTLEQLGIPQEALPPGIDARIVVSTNAATGPIKRMNAVTGAPGSKNTFNFRDWKALGVPCARIHDMNDFIDYANPWAVDVTRIFRNPSADEKDIANYRFDETDWLLRRIESAGSKVFYRLGQPNGTRLSSNADIMPPVDFEKYARVCSTIVGRYCKTVKYWEFWNEPDLKTGPGGRRNAFWGGTREEFVRLFATVAKRLKAEHPDILVGGPGLSSDFPWCEELLDELKREGAPLDFLSWHCYGSKPETFAERARQVREMLDRRGYAKAESIICSWNYVRGWDHASLEYSHKVHGGAFAARGAAFIAAVMTVCQSEPVDMMMIRDAYSGCPWNALFDPVLGEPLPGYYAFYAWKRLSRLGAQLLVAVASEKIAGLSAVAAQGADGRRGLLVTRCPPSNNDRLYANVILELPGTDPSAEIVCHMTDVARSFTEVPLERDAKGRFSIVMKPFSFAYIEY